MWPRCLHFICCRYRPLWESSGSAAAASAAANLSFLDVSLPVWQTLVCPSCRVVHCNVVIWCVQCRKAGVVKCSLACLDSGLRVAPPACIEKHETSPNARSATFVKVSLLSLLIGDSLFSVVNVIYILTKSMTSLKTSILKVAPSLYNCPCLSVSGRNHQMKRGKSDGGSFAFYVLSFNMNTVLVLKTGRQTEEGEGRGKKKGWFGIFC